MAMDSFIIRPAERKDINELWNMIEELGHYERMPGPALNNPSGIERDGFGENPLFKCAVAENSNQQLAGYVIYFPIYIPRMGKSMYLQDLFVKEQFRRLGIGRKLFTKMAEDALKSGCLRIDWRVLIWNEAKTLYEKVGGINITEKYGWQSFELSQKGIDLLLKEKKI